METSYQLDSQSISIMNGGGVFGDTTANKFEYFSEKRHEFQQVYDKISNKEVDVICIGYRVPMVCNLFGAKIKLGNCKISELFIYQYSSIFIHNTHIPKLFRYIKSCICMQFHGKLVRNWCGGFGICLTRKWVHHDRNSKRVVADYRFATTPFFLCGRIIELSYFSHITVRNNSKIHKLFTFKLYKVHNHPVKYFHRPHDDASLPRGV